MTTSFAAVPSRVTIERWPSERPLFIVSLLAATLIWVVLVASVIGAVYAAVLLSFFFIGHVAFMARLRGSAVRVGPAQLPELHEAVTRLAGRLGLDPVPAVYLMQADGALNALATRFLGSHVVVLFADLLDACGPDEAARDMIIAHELGHVHAGHLRWMWYLAPSHLIPFLGSALSRAREFTCDRYGLAGAGSREGAILGLTILAAGPTHARRVNRALLVRQEEDLQSGWMTLGTWFASHPPISRRIAALEPALEAERPVERPGPGRALALLLGLGTIPVLAGIALALFLPTSITDGLRAVGAAGDPEYRETAARSTLPPDSLAADDLRRFSEFIDANWRAQGLPPDGEQLYLRWMQVHPDQPVPIDPYSGMGYLYRTEGEGYVLQSVGVDGTPGTPDDLVWSVTSLR